MLYARCFTTRAWWSGLWDPVWPEIRLHEHCMCNMWPTEMVLMNLLEPRHDTVSLHAHTILKTNWNLQTSSHRINLFSSKLWPLLRITHLPLLQNSVCSNQMNCRVCFRHVVVASLPVLWISTFEFFRIVQYKQNLANKIDSSLKMLSLRFTVFWPICDLSASNNMSNTEIMPIKFTWKQVPAWSGGRGACLVWGVPACSQGCACLAWGGACLLMGGEYPSMHWGRPPREQNHRCLWKYNLA